MRNFWCQILVQSQHSGKMMLHLAGFEEISMLNALERISRKSHLDLRLKEHSDKLWTATHTATATKYVVEMRDDEPPVDKVGKVFSYCNYTLSTEKKPKLLDKWLKKPEPSPQLELF